VPSVKQLDIEKARYLAIFARRPRWSRCAILSGGSVLREYFNRQRRNEHVAKLISL
jgi:hypothetical protein